MKTMLVTGSGGLVGYNVSKYFANQGWQIIGIDNNMRRQFFGPGGNVNDTIKILRQDVQLYEHHYVDITKYEELESVFLQHQFDAIVHAAGQPSHDYAAKIPILDFQVNAGGTLNLLELCRKYNPQSPFLFLSTNKVYGDNPNHLELAEHEFRYMIESEDFKDGISESMPIDDTMHSLFGVSKTAADLYVQEYGRYFKLPTCVLRCGCITGAEHAGVPLHGFLNYLIRANVTEELYQVHGYKGKQVRDNIHPYDIARFIELYIDDPRPAEIYNLGGGIENSCSILEAFALAEKETGKKMNYIINEMPRKGDHMCYYSDLSKVKEHYPEWHISIGLGTIILMIAKAMSESC